MFVQWLAAGEREFEGAWGDGYLQGLLLSEISAPCFTTATERRVVMLDGAVRDSRRTISATGVSFEVPWSQVRGYWSGVMPFPPDLWRDGFEGPVVILCLDPAAAESRDLVLCTNLEAWIDTSRAMGIDLVRD